MLFCIPFRRCLHKVEILNYTKIILKAFRRNGQVFIVRNSFIAKKLALQTIKQLQDVFSLGPVLNAVIACCFN